jgi:hypothetical protein
MEFLMTVVISVLAAMLATKNARAEILWEKKIQLYSELVEILLEMQRPL